MKGLLFFVNFFAIGYANNWIFRENSSDAYLILGGETSWIFAREMCLAQGADLLTIKDEAEKDWVFRHFPVIPRDKAATRDHFVLLGLTDIEGNDNWHWVDDTPLDDSLFEWDKHHHDIIQTCAALNTKSGKLHNLDCDYRILPEVTTRFVCKAHYRFLIDRRLSSHLHQAVFSLSRKRRHLRLCESGWHFHGTECWKLVEVKRHWFHAQVQCWNNEGRAALASLRNEDEADYVKELHEKVYGVIPAEGFWVNAFDSANEGNWTTHDGKPVYTRWAGGNPPNDPLHKSNCLIERRDGLHKDVNCGRRIKFFCRKPAKPLL